MMIFGPGPKLTELERNELEIASFGLKNGAGSILQSNNICQEYVGS